MKIVAKDFFISLVYCLIFIDRTSSHATIYTRSPAAYAEGANVTLSCKAYRVSDRTRWLIKPGPNQETLSIRCQTVTRHPRIRVKSENCDSVAGWYNLTIDNIMFEDRGFYHCLSGQDAWKKVQVYVYQRGGPKLTVGALSYRNMGSANDTGSALNLIPQLSAERHQIKLHCRSGCGYPAPSIRWYWVDLYGSKDHISVRYYSTIVTNCSDGLWRSESTLTLTAQYKDPHSAVQDITCEAGQDFTQYQGKLLIKTAARTIIYGVKALSRTDEHRFLVGWIIALAAILGVTLVSCIVYFLWRRPEKRRTTRSWDKTTEAMLNGKKERRFSHPHSEPDPDAPRLVLTLGEGTVNKIKESLIPSQLNRGTTKQRYRTIPLPLHEGKFPTLTIGRGEYCDQDDYQYSFKVDTSGYISRHQIKMTVQEEDILINNLGTYPIAVLRYKHSTKDFIKMGGSWSVKTGDRVYLEDEYSTNFKITHNAAFKDQRNVSSTDRNMPNVAVWPPRSITLVLEEFCTHIQRPESRRISNTVEAV